MIKQEKLISDLIEYLESKITENKELIEDGAEPDYINSLYGRIEGMDIAIEKIKELFDPVPTINPGDKVRYKRNSAYGLGEVKGIDAFVKFEALAHSTRVSPEDLEVVKDE
ncbi:hypothetical protein BK126_04540 [Paenibacillus sp. FSL H7-0326]|uniref:hypothetical protein n=1 Tax=Paenibacillus sp. FSL H7-0326 TaxID=1921144 RepID=UPI00096F7E59|nr:hypothetical protein [Paenibacillus sp. FSL H7-0326]OMC71371.1 hypothetical protein BK126_04540 [Paenibacillus sp. FSL H7-0326]